MKIPKIIRRNKIDVLTADQLLELILLSSLPPIIGFLFHPADPFFLQSKYPVLLAPPFLMALRYGLRLAMVSFAMIGVGITFAYLNHIGNISDYPTLLLFIILVFTLVTGEVTDQSLSQLHRSRIKNKLLTRRFNEFTNAYHVMKVSHDQLKEQLANTRVSLREALQMVRDKLRKQQHFGRKGLSATVGEEVLSILSYFCAIQIAGVYQTETDGTISRNPVAVKGDMGTLKEKDALVQKACKQKELISVLPELYASSKHNESTSDLLAVVPIIDVSGYIWGIVAVKNMHFTAFQPETLHLMQLIGAYTGDLLCQSENIFYAADGRKKFIGELQNNWHLSKKFSLTSSLICITFQREIPADRFIEAIVNRIRSLDYACFFKDKRDRLVCFLLMPLMGERDYYGFRNDLDGYLRSSLGHAIEEVGCMFNHYVLDGRHPFDDIMNFITDGLGKGVSFAKVDTFSREHEMNTTHTVIPLEKKREKIDSIQDHACIDPLSATKKMLPSIAGSDR